MVRIAAVGQRIGARHVVRGVIGFGSMGAVYEVEDERGGRYAMKVALPELDDGGEAARRLAREANALQLLDHPNIVAAVELVADEGRLYLVMELVHGEPLAALVARGPMPRRRALVLARQVLDALEHAHQRGLVHRDLKPDNAIVTAAGAPHDPYDRVKVLDFGLVKLMDDAAALIGGERLTRTGITFGTPAYMAPESALGRLIDERADLYAAGVMIFELLTGRLPFAAEEPLALLKAHVSAPVPRLADVAPDVAWPPALEALVAGALGKRPEERFASATAMRAALDHAFLTLG